MKLPGHCFDAQSRLRVSRSHGCRRIALGARQLSRRDQVRRRESFRRQKFLEERRSSGARLAHGDPPAPEIGNAANLFADALGQDEAASPRNPGDQYRAAYASGGNRPDVPVRLLRDMQPGKRGATAGEGVQAVEAPVPECRQARAGLAHGPVEQRVMRAGEHLRPLRRFGAAASLDPRQDFRAREEQLPRDPPVGNPAGGSEVVHLALPHAQKCRHFLRREVARRRLRIVFERFLRHGAYE